MGFMIIFFQREAEYSFFAGRSIKIIAIKLNSAEME